METRSGDCCNNRRMNEPQDSPGRNVDPFDAPDDYADPWRSRRIPMLLAGLVVIVLIVVLWLVIG
jgi:hypothetical protein